MSETTDILESLEAQPLVGRHRAAVRKGLAQAAAAVARSRDRGDTARLLGLGARLARADGARDAVQRLNAARSAASEAGDLVLEDRLALLTVRSLAKARSHHRAADLLADILPRAQRTPSLTPELDLARAAVGIGEPRVHLEAALSALDANEVERVAGAWPVLSAAVNDDGGWDFAVRRTELDPHLVGFAVPEGSALREDLYRLILRRLGSESGLDLLDRYLPKGG